MYINCKTYLSLRYGTFSTEELVNAAVESGVQTIALTNINSTADAWDFVQYCQQAGIKPIVGTEIRNDNRFCYILLAKSNEGLCNINRFLSTHLVGRMDFPQQAPTLEDVCVIYSLGSVNPYTLAPNEFIGVQPTDINLLYGLDMSKLSGKLVIRQPVTFQDQVHYNIHRILRAVDRNTILSKQDLKDCAGKHEYFVPLSSLLLAFKQYPQILSNTFLLMDSCTVDMEFKSDKNKRFYTSSKRDDLELLEKLAYEGLNYRYGTNIEARKRVAKELKIIDELNFSAYFLITWDFVRYAQSRGFYYVGRGSGANSIVAYCLKITNVDPIDLDLFFERFLNPARTSPPDFDIDFSWLDRDEIMDYVIKRYGRDHVALLGMISTFQDRAPIREFSKVYGLAKSEIDQLVAGNFNEYDKRHMQIRRYANLVQNWPNSLSIHPCGMLISEKPIYYYTATDMLQKAMPVSQIDMFVAESIGLYKFDILSQRGLGHIKEAINTVKNTQGIDIDIHKVDSFKTDKLINANLEQGNTIGCFYIESPAMRSVLRKLNCNNYHTLVAASSIIRPGVGSSGMMTQYIWRSHNPTKFAYLHPILAELLSETYGVMVYQEDVIKVAHLFAGLSLSDADILRRAMSGKYRGNKEIMTRIEETFISNCKQKGYPESIYGELWRQMKSFAGYSFSKAHSASFAVESYQSLYLKTYFPVEFMVAVINNLGGFYNTELYFQQLKNAGVKIHPPCINISEKQTIIVNGEVFTGFMFVKNLEASTISAILKHRSKDGTFSHLQEFIERTAIVGPQLELLIDVKAFSFTGESKKQLLWKACYLGAKSDKHLPAHQSMFMQEPTKFVLPALEEDELEDLLSDIENLRFTIADIFNLVDDDLKNYVTADDLVHYKKKQVTCLGYLICTKQAVTKKGNKLMHFGTFIDQKGKWLDTVHFPDAAAKYPFTGRGFYLISGEVTEEFQVLSINVSHMQKIGIKQLPATRRL